MIIMMNVLTTCLYKYVFKEVNFSIKYNCITLVNKKGSFIDVKFFFEEKHDDDMCIHVV